MSVGIIIFQPTFIFDLKTHSPIMLCRIHCTMNAGGRQYLITGGNPLQGEIHLAAAKNSVLPLIAGSILSKEDIELQNVPDIDDIRIMLDIIRSIGGKAEYRNRSVFLNCANINPVEIDNRLTDKLRASIFLLGPVLSRFRRIRLGLPGGCAIGERAIDLHISGLRTLGVTVDEFPDFIDCAGGGRDILSGTVTLRMPSVGATENLIMAGVLGSGRTVIKNAAREPEITDLCNYINILGGKVFGGGTDTVTVDGVTRLSGGCYRPYADRIAGPTYLAAAAATGGRVTVRGLKPLLCDATLSVLFRAGCRIRTGTDFVSLSAPQRLRSVPNLETAPYPGFPTDMQPQITAVLALANGESMITENLFENRFRYVEQLKKLGAQICVGGSRAVIRGVSRLHGAAVMSEDLRGGAALVIAALAANGESVVSGVHHIDRGYENMDGVLRSLGAKIQKI